MLPVAVEATHVCSASRRRKKRTGKRLILGD